MDYFRIRNQLAQIVLLAFALSARHCVTAEEPLPPTEKVEKLVADLDAADFYQRESAMHRLRAMVLDERHGGAVADALDNLSLQSQLSFETQQRLAEVLRGISRPSAAPRESLTEDQSREIVSQLCDDRFSMRENAGRRLQWLLGNHSNIVPLMSLIKKKLSESDLPSATRQDLERYFTEVRRAWLSAPAEKCPLPIVSDEQILGWVKLVTLPTEDEAVFVKQRIARIELEDALVRDELRERTTKAINDQLEQSTDAPAAERLRELVDLTRPAMVAEIWSVGRIVNWFGGALVANTERTSARLMTTQYLHIGVPQYPEGAVRATHFDRCDDKTAHCVSGNTLLPGDYPVGTAFSHPDGEATMFHLINLPTPRRRLLYEYSSRRSETVRLRELSQRTCDAFLTQERKLTEPDINVLALLDRAVMSHFAGQFFRKLKDAPLDDSRGGFTSAHLAVCYVVALKGTREAAPGLIKAIAEKRFSSPGEGAHYNLPYMALLAIAVRDPWDKVDDWLEQQLDSNEPLLSNVDSPPELSATAAGILGDRLGQSFHSLGLVPTGDGFGQQTGLTTYRFENEARRAVARQLIRAQRQEVSMP